MNLLTVLLQAPAAGGGSMMWIMLIAMFVIMYFFMIRPQNKKQKEIAKFRKNLEVGQSVVTAGGIYGKIKEVEDNSWTNILVFGQLVFLFQLINNTVQSTIDETATLRSAIQLDNFHVFIQRNIHRNIGET